MNSDTTSIGSALRNQTDLTESGCSGDEIIRDKEVL